MRVMNQSVVGKHSIFFSIFQYLSVFFKADREHVSDEPERGWKTFNVPIWKYFTWLFSLQFNNANFFTKIFINRFLFWSNKILSKIIPKRICNVLWPYVWVEDVWFARFSEVILCFPGTPKGGSYDLSVISWCSNKIRLFICTMFSKKMFPNPLSKETGQMHWLSCKPHSRRSRQRSAWGKIKILIL